MHLPFLVGIVALMAAGAAQAQSYRCSSSGGQVYFSDRPCNNTTLRMYGEARPAQPSRYAATPAGIPKAQEHVKYLSSACASISEAIRTGPARGVRGDVVRGLHEEYREKCSVEDQEARARVHQDLQNQRQTQVAARETALVDRQQARERGERCNAMRDVVALKRKREPELNTKEVEALRSLEKTYNEVCLGR